MKDIQQREIQLIPVLSIIRFEKLKLFQKVDFKRIEIRHSAINFLVK
jgi:hypothetical protein